MASQVASRQPRVVLFEPFFLDKVPTSWPGTPLEAIAHEPLADYVLAHYRSCKLLTSAASWRFHFMVRKDLACP